MEAVNVLNQAHGDNWSLYHADAAEALRGLPDHSVDLSVFSPPFGALYVYSPSPRDLGNCKDITQFWQHFDFVSHELLRVTKPGRNVCVHVAQLSTTMATHGVTGLYDFRGDTIRHFVSSGFVYHGEVCIDKNPQLQAIRTKSKALLFVQKNKDSSWSRPAHADYILIFRAPGENAVPIKPDVSNEEWIEWAHPIWYGIEESNVLNVAVARANDDERHICPLQLGTIERCVRLWSNPGETVLSPFAGIGSEGVMSLRLGRKFMGIELKDTYFATARRNLEQAEAASRVPDLFTWADQEMEEVTL